MPGREVEFWFDFASTYSYVSARRIDSIASPSGIRVRWMPFLLGPVFAAQGWNTSPFNVYPAKGRYMWRDIERLCARHAIDFKRPEVFPQFALLATRVAVAGAGEQWLPPFCMSMFHAEYGRGRDITGADAVTEALERLGLDAAEWISRAQSADVKQTLRDRVTKAQDRGIFGAPTFITSTGEMFWGDDRLEQAMEWQLKHR